MISSKSGILGFCESLDSLQEDFRCSPEHLRKIEGMRSEFAAWRRVRGDGNCYYRALGVGHMEHLLSSEGRPQLQAFRDRLATLQGDAQSTIGPLIRFLDGEVDQQAFYKGILVDPELDKALVWAVRHLVAAYVLAHQDMELNGLPLSIAVEASHGDLESWINGEVLRWGSEAELLVHALAPTCLACSVLLVQLDKTNSSFPRYRFPDETSTEKPDVTMLFKPGHYDLLYPTNIGQELLSLEHALDLKATCEQPQECPICMCEPDPAEKVSLACKHVMCQPCLDNVVAAAGARLPECPICQAPLVDTTTV